jgi:predicted alpha/beta-hydrolase family hydrolase
MQSHLLTDVPAAGPQHATLLLAHGAGAAMDSIFMQMLAQALNAEGIAVVRFEFPYMQARRLTGTRTPPNRIPILLDSFRQQWATVRTWYPGPLLVGGKSMGARVASMLVDELGASGLVCFAYPFHPPAKPEKPRVEHLANMHTPALFLQGTRDPFGKPDEVQRYGLAQSIELHWLESADHDFKPLKRSGHDQQNIIEQAASAVSHFCQNRLNWSSVGTSFQLPRA